MTKFIVAYDNQEPILGSYFIACKEKLTTFLQEKDSIEFTEIPSNRCNQSG